MHIQDFVRAFGRSYSSLAFVLIVQCIVDVKLVSAAV